jgi:hypothetical protein
MALMHLMRLSPRPEHRKSGHEDLCQNAQRNSKDAIAERGDYTIVIALLLNARTKAPVAGSLRIERGYDVRGQPGRGVLRIERPKLGNRKLAVLLGKDPVLFERSAMYLMATIWIVLHQFRRRLLGKNICPT